MPPSEFLRRLQAEELRRKQTPSVKSPGLQIPLAQRLKYEGIIEEQLRQSKIAGELRAKHDIRIEASGLRGWMEDVRRHWGPECPPVRRVEGKFYDYEKDLPRSRGTFVSTTSIAGRGRMYGNGYLITNFPTQDEFVYYARNAVQTDVTKRGSWFHLYAGFVYEQYGKENPKFFIHLGHRAYYNIGNLLYEVSKSVRVPYPTFESVQKGLIQTVADSNPINWMDRH